MNEDKEYRKYVQQVTGPLTTMRITQRDSKEPEPPSWWVSDEEASQSNSQAMMQMRRRS